MYDFDAKQFVHGRRHDIGFQFGARLHHVTAIEDPIVRALLDKLCAVPYGRELDTLHPILAEAILEIAVQTAQAAYNEGVRDGEREGRNDTIDALAEKFMIADVQAGHAANPSNAYQSAHRFIKTRAEERAKRKGIAP